MTRCDHDHDQLRRLLRGGHDHDHDLVTAGKGGYGNSVLRLATNAVSFKPPGALAAHPCHIRLSMLGFSSRAFRDSKSIGIFVGASKAITRGAKHCFYPQ